MNKKAEELPFSSKFPRSIDEAPEYLASIIEMGMAAQLSPLSGDPQSPQKKQSPSKKD